MTPAEIVAGAFRGLEYAGLLGFVGVVVMRQLARQPPHLGWVRPGMDGALALALLGGVATVALAPSWIGAARVAVELAALVMCLRWGPGAVPAGFAAVLLLALAGHATGAQPVVPAILVDELDVLSAGIWGGGHVDEAALREPDHHGRRGGRAHGSAPHRLHPGDGGHAPGGHLHRARYGARAVQLARCAGPRGVVMDDARSDDRFT